MIDFLGRQLLGEEVYSFRPDLRPLAENLEQTALTLEAKPSIVGCTLNSCQICCSCSLSTVLSSVLAVCKLRKSAVAISHGLVGCHTSLTNVRLSSSNFFTCKTSCWIVLEVDPFCR